MTILMKETLIAFFRRTTSAQFVELFATRGVCTDTSGGAGTRRLAQSGWNRGFNARRTVLRTSSLLKPRINEKLTLRTAQRSRSTESRSRVLLADSGHFESACCHLLLGDQRAGDHLANLSYILESVGELLIPAKGMERNQGDSRSSFEGKSNDTRCGYLRTAHRAFDER